MGKAADSHGSRRLILADHEFKTAYSYDELQDGFRSIRNDGLWNGWALKQVVTPLNHSAGQKSRGLLSSGFECKNE